MNNYTPFEFEGPSVGLFIDNPVDPIEKLENNKDMILDQLGLDKNEFLSWLSTISVANISSLKIETLQLLVSCWLASKKLYSSMLRGKF